MGVASGVLDGVRVLDFTTTMAGPMCTRLLADLGAEVIKVESPDGDHLRVRPPLREGPNGPHSTYFGQLNRGKRSIVLDLKNPVGRDLAVRLAGLADVVVENFRPGVMRRLGLDYPALSEANAGLVYCAISGYGQTGPSAQRPAYAPAIHADSGFDLTHLGYQDGADRPAATGLFIADVFGAVYAFGAIQAALLHRHRTGRGQAIDLSLLETMLALQVFEVQHAQFPGRRRRPLYRPLRTTDGFVMAAPVNQRNYQRLVEALGHPEWGDDPRFTTPAEREHHWDELMSLVEAWTSARTAADCERTLLAAGVACARYREVPEVLADPQLAHREALATARDGAGPFLMPNPPFRLSAAPVAGSDWVPGLGEHGPDVLTELLDASPDRVRRWHAAGAFGHRNRSDAC
ncbi:CoA transferase [Pseudonocardia eucalypti]|uniref:CoA transferase n=1 Tax=Pseudonocardia eucalypti TaxID=648755 RepID=A0ABP9PYM6_9PSEU